MKRLGKVLIALLMVSSLVACSFGNTGASENETDDNGNEILDIISDKIEQASIPKDTFEYVKGDTIELEVGTIIDENNIDQYILSDDYSNITIDDSNVKDYYSSNNMELHEGKPSAYYEVSKYNQKEDSSASLKLYVVWVDTQAPTCDTTDVYWYTYRIAEGETNTVEFNTTEVKFCLPLPLMDTEFLGLKDNGPQIIPNEVLIDGRLILYNDDEGYTYSESTNLSDRSFDILAEESDMYIPVTPGDYEIQLNVRDVGNNKSSFTVTLHVVEDLSPEDKEMLNANGISNETIDSAVAELHDDYKNNVSAYSKGNHWQYSFEN